MEGTMWSVLPLKMHFHFEHLEALFPAASRSDHCGFFVGWMVDILKSSLVIHFPQMRLCEHGGHKKRGGNMYILFKNFSRDEIKIDQRSIRCQQQKRTGGRSIL